MNATIFVELKFWLLIVLSFVSPVLIYAVLIAKRSISRTTVLIFGVVLVAIAGVDVYLLRSLETLARHSASLLDDAIFSSEISVALYIIPFFFGGVGVNIVSHVIVVHLLKAEKQYRIEHPDVPRS